MFLSRDLNLIILLWSW